MVKDGGELWVQYLTSGRTTSVSQDGGGTAGRGQAPGGIGRSRSGPEGFATRVKLGMRVLGWGCFGGSDAL